MNLVDSCGWLEFFADGPNADFFSFPLKKIEQLIVPTICLYEVFKKVILEKNEDAALHAVAAMKQGIVIEFDSNLALSAAKISMEFKIPLADSVILATSRLYKATLWTQNGHFENIPNVKFRIKKK